MGQPQNAAVGLLVPGRASAGVVWRPNNPLNAVDWVASSVTLALDVLGTQSLVAALSAASSTNSVACVAAHANLAVKQAGFCLGESCHDGATEFPYLTATTCFGYVQG